MKEPLVHRMKTPAESSVVVMSLNSMEESQPKDTNENYSNSDDDWDFDEPTRVVHIPFSRSKEDEESGSSKGKNSVAESIGMEKDISCKAGLKRVMS